MVPVVIPPLAERPAEVAALARHFCARAAKATGREVTLDDAAVAALAEARWPGNVRQLENLVERLVVLPAARSSAPATWPGGSAGWVGAGIAPGARVAGLR